MTTRIGRAVFTNAPALLAWDGDTLTVNININPSSLNDAKALRQQVLGLANNDDEPVIPFTSTDDPDLDGYYVVEGVNVEPLRTYLTTKMMRVGVGLRRVAGGYAKPVIELSGIMAQRSTTHVTSYLGRVAFPQTGQDFQTGPFTFNGSQIFAADDGTVRFHIATPPVTGTASYYVTPQSYYVGAAAIENLVGGVWRKVVGKQAAPFGSWRITNGLIRLSTSVEGARSTITLEFYDSGTWVVVGEFVRGFVELGVWASIDFAVDNPQALTLGGGATSALVSPTIIRNSPERVTIKIPQTLGSETYSLARGHGWVDLVITGTSLQHGVGSATAIASTDNTAWMQRTAADGNGNRFFVACPVANTVDGANGRISIDSAATSASFSVGIVEMLAGSSEVTASYAVNSFTQRVVTR